MLLRDDVTLLDYKILGLLPLVGDKIGDHDLKKPVRAIVEDLGYEITPDEANGRLRRLALLGMTLLVQGATGSKTKAGWQITPLGRKIVGQWDALLVHRALTVANRDGEGLAAVRARANGPVAAYVMTPARYERVNDDPAAGPPAEVEPEPTDEVVPEAGHTKRQGVTA